MTQYGGMGLSLLSSAASTATTAYNDYVWTKAKRAIQEYQKQTQKVLTGLSLTVSINSAGKVRTELTEEAKKQEAAIEMESIAKAGAIEAEQAKVGAIGKRVQLATEQATAIPAARAKEEIKRELGKKQDALIDQEKAQYIQAMAGLLGMPSEYIPDTDWGSYLASFTASAAGTASSYLSEE